MGYRSDVVLVFYCASKDKDYPLLKLWVDENMKEELAYMRVVNNGEWKGFKFSWENVKWYDGYEDVERVRAAMQRFKEVFDEVDAPEFSYEFVRVGENEDDTELYRSRDAVGLMYVSREIVGEF